MNSLVLPLQLSLVQDKHVPLSAAGTFCCWSGHLASTAALIFQTSPKQIKTKIKERRVLLAEKKNTMAIQVFRHRELAQKIAGLTEDIAELKSKKALLLNQLNCTDDHGSQSHPGSGQLGKKRTEPPNLSWMS